jgi:hypothetical protein
MRISCLHTDTQGPHHPHVSAYCVQSSFQGPSRRFNRVDYSCSTTLRRFRLSESAADFRRRRFPSGAAFLDPLIHPVNHFFFGRSLFFPNRPEVIRSARCDRQCRREANPNSHPPSLSINSDHFFWIHGFRRLFRSLFKTHALDPTRFDPNTTSFDFLLRCDLSTQQLRIPSLEPAVR